MALLVRAFPALLLVASLVSHVPAATITPAAASELPAADWVLPAEFERQQALLLAWDGGNALIQRALCGIIAEAWRNTAVIVLVRDDDEEFEAVDVLRQVGIPRRAVTFLALPHDSVWTRDYGPAIVRSSGGSLQVVDVDYQRGERPNDDELPPLIGPQLELPTVRAPLNLEGGNLISNGAGLCLTTMKLLEQNADRGYGELELRTVLQQYYGASTTVFLEPLVGEPTGHVDMFATFTAADTVVLAEISPLEDAENAEVLNRNAARLQGLPTPRGPLKVVRIPMPASNGNTWRTYTNVLFLNGLLLVPGYAGADSAEAALALSVYRRLLPGWRVATVECSELIGLGGALHCISRNLPAVGRLPIAAAEEPEAEPAAPVIAEPGDVPAAPPEPFATPGLLEATRDGWEPMEPGPFGEPQPLAEPAAANDNAAFAHEGVFEDPLRIPFARD
jgi:agmatine/peptidylarginine deiminase